MDTTAAVASVAPQAIDFSLIALFMSASFVVKIVMIGLLAASIWSWAIIVDKTLLFTRVGREMNRFERIFWSGQSLEELYDSMAERPNVGLA